MNTLFPTIVILLLFVRIAEAQVYLTKNEALSLYLGHDYTRTTIFLNDSQIKEIQSRSKAKVESKIVTYYHSEKGIAFFETRTVRTMPATFIVVISRDSTILAVEMLAFYEPEDYLPSKRWLTTFSTKRLSDDLWLKRGIINVSGATMSAHAITESIRKFLATYEIAIQKEHQ